MSKAEERAYETYPKMSRISEPHGLIPAGNKSHYLGDGNEGKREGFIVGYHQAEKDLELTWQDIVMIDKLLIDLGMMFPCKSTPDYFQEVLNRFKKGKG